MYLDLRLICMYMHVCFIRRPLVSLVFETISVHCTIHTFHYMLKYILCCAMYILEVNLLYFSPINGLQNVYLSQLHALIVSTLFLPALIWLKYC